MRLYVSCVATWGSVVIGANGVVLRGLRKRERLLWRPWPRDGRGSGDSKRQTIWHVSG